MKGHDDFPHRDTIIQSHEESVLAKIDSDNLLRSLDDADSTTVRLVHQYERPDDYDGKWPPAFEDVGRYVGRKFFGRVLSAMWVSRRVRRIERRFWNIARRGLNICRWGR